MLNIGIDENNNLVYESRNTFGHAIWPAPVLTPAKITYESEGKLVAASQRKSIGDESVFREDSFDPVSRIRRGRFYFAGNQQPIEWRVYTHPATPGETWTQGRDFSKKRLITYFGNPLGEKLSTKSGEQPLVLLGRDDRFTIWTVINIEAISSGEDLVTLKARSGLGVLPRVDERQIPEKFRATVIESLDGFADEVHRSGAVSVIDRARDAASQVLLAYFNATAGDAKDLQKLVPRLDENKKVIAASATTIIARLHARAKPVEKIRHGLRPIREQDADLAVQCVGTILCELGWAEWS